MARADASTDCIFANTVVPEGIYTPRYSSSFMQRCGTPRGTVTCQRKSSFTIALTYGKAERSAWVGSLSGPTTTSSSRCARFRTSGCRIMAQKNAMRVAAV